ncbi:MAG TPA: hypothetical protein VLA68_02060 [Nitrososphaera sp.]|nr:hypothetical protein [Nitrososphaera sp.]
MYRPRETRDIYIESLSINSSNLEKQLADQSVEPQEIRMIIDFVMKTYNDHLSSIIEECSKDTMALERVPSPLKLFIDCLSKARESAGLSDDARRLIGGYVSAWEDWM